MSRRGELGLAALVSLVLLALNAAWVAAVVGPLHKPRKVLETDHYRYIDMAEAPPGRAVTDRGREAPFCYRVLAPAVVWVLGRAGVDTNAGFYLVTNVFLLLFLVALHALLRHEGASLREALAGLVLVALVPGAVRWYEYQYWMPDPPCLFFVTLGLLWMRQGRERPLLLLSTVAVLARETYLLLLPVVFVHAWRTASLRVALARTARLAVVTLGTLAVLHAAIHPVAGGGLVAAAREMIPFRARHLLEGQVYAATLGTFGVLFPLWWLRPERVLAFLRRRPEDGVLAAAAYASLAFANNTDRLLVYALPAVVPAAVGALRALASVVGRWGLVAVAAVLLQAFFYARTPFHELGISVYPPTPIDVLAVLGIAWLGARLVLRAGASGG